MSKSKDFTLALEEVINLIEDNVAVLDLEWRFLFVNDATLKLNGLTREEMVGKHFSEVLPALAGSPLDKAMLKAYQTHGNVSVEQNNPDTGRWYRIDVIPAATSVILHTVDITETKRTGALNQRLMRSLDSITEPIFIMDNELRYVYINATAAKFVGRDRAELLGRNIFEQSPWLRETNFGRACQKAIASGEAFTVEDYYKPRDRWLNVRYFPAPDFFTVHITDITELKHMQQQMTDLMSGSASKAQIHSAFDLMPTPMLMLDHDLRFTYANQAALDVNHRSMKQTVGVRPLDVNPKLVESPLYKAGIKAIKTGKRQSAEFLLPPSERWFKAEFIPWKDEIIIAAVDITKLKQSEDSVGLLTETLEQAMDGGWDRPSARNTGKKH